MRFLLCSISHQPDRLTQETGLRFREKEPLKLGSMFQDSLSKKAKHKKWSRGKIGLGEKLGSPDAMCVWHTSETLLRAEADTEI